MASKDERALKRQLLHSMRPKLIKKCHAQNVSIYGSKNDLVSRILHSITASKQNEEKKNKKKKKVNRKPLKMSDPIYNDENSNKLSNKFSIKKKKKGLKNDKKHDKSTNLKRKRKRKLKPKARRKNTDENNAKSDEIRPTEKKQENKTKHGNEMNYIYEIINMKERPFLDGKHCKIIAILDNNQYRVSLINNGSQQIVSKYNLKTITAKHKRKKAINLPSIKQNDNESIKDSIELIKAFKINSDHIDVLAVGVFVNYQMILKVFINTDIEYLFGTKYKSFKTECLSFLEDIYYRNCDEDEYDEKYNKKRVVNKLMDRYIMLYYECNDKQVIFLMNRNNRNNNKYRINNIDSIKAMDLAIISGCNIYKDMPSDFDIIKQVFDIHDVYGFGEINQKEFNKFLSALTVNVTINKSSSTNLFNKIDKDKINAITFNQFVKYMIENQKNLWKLLLELATDYELDINIKLVMYQSKLSKIHKLILIMYEMYEIILITHLFNDDDIDIYEDKMVQYIQFIKKNQNIIDNKIIDYKHNKKCKNRRKYLQQTSDFIHNNMPNID